MTQKIVVLGAKGFLGLPIVRAFEAKGWEVATFDRSPTEESGRQAYLVDLFDEDSMNHALSKAKPNVVVSTAWSTEHGKFWNDESNLLYRDATLKFAELSFLKNVEMFIGIGTMSEYGKSPGLCNAEATKLIASDIYSKCKIDTGVELRRLGERYGQKTHWARVFQAFGPNEKPKRFVPGLISSLRAGERFSILNPESNMDWIHTADVASALVYMVEHELSHFVDIGTGVCTSVRQFSELICNELALDSNLLDFPNNPSQQSTTAVVDTKSQLLAHGWQPFRTLRDRVRSLR